MREMKNKTLVVKDKKERDENFTCRDVRQSAAATLCRSSPCRII